MTTTTTFKVSDINTWDFAAHYSEISDQMVTDVAASILGDFKTTLNDVVAAAGFKGFSPTLMLENMKKLFLADSSIVATKKTGQGFAEDLAILCTVAFVCGPNIEKAANKCADKEKWDSLIVPVLTRYKVKPRIGEDNAKRDTVTLVRVPQACPAVMCAVYKALSSKGSFVVTDSEVGKTLKCLSVTVFPGIIKNFSDGEFSDNHMSYLFVARVLVSWRMSAKVDNRKTTKTKQQKFEDNYKYNKIGLEQKLLSDDRCTVMLKCFTELVTSDTCAVKEEVKTDLHTLVNSVMEKMDATWITEDMEKMSPLFKAMKKYTKKVPTAAWTALWASQTGDITLPSE